MTVRPALTPADRARRRGRRLRVALAMAAAIAVFLALAAPLAGALIDDTFIHLQYARNFRDGHGLVFNPGEPVFGTTSPAWSMGLGVLGRAGVDLVLPPGWARSCSGCSRSAPSRSRCGASSARSWAARVRLRARPNSHGRSASLAFAADAWLVRWSATGMETACGVVPRRRRLRQLLRRAAVGEPRLAVRDLVVARRARASRGRAARRAAGGPHRPLSAPGRARLLRSAVVLALAALVQAPWLVYAFTFYGTLVPQTLAAKTAGGVGPAVFAASLGRQAQEILATRAVECVAFAALLPPLAAALWRRRAEHFLPLAWLVVLPLPTPCAACTRSRATCCRSRRCCCSTAGARSPRWSPPSAGRRRARSAVLVVASVLGLSLNGFLWARFVVPQARTFSGDARAVLGGYGAWARAHTPPGTLVAIPDIGLFAWEAERPVLDLAGLVSPGIARLIQRYGNSEEGTW